jgi:hypothetical protein
MSWAEEQLMVVCTVSSVLVCAFSGPVKVTCT